MQVAYSAGEAIFSGLDSCIIDACVRDLIDDICSFESIHHYILMPALVQDFSNSNVLAMELRRLGLSHQAIIMMAQCNIKDRFRNSCLYLRGQQVS